MPAATTALALPTIHLNGTGAQGRACWLGSGPFLADPCGAAACLYPPRKESSTKFAA